MKVCGNCTDNIEEEAGWYQISLYPPDIACDSSQKLFHFCTWRCMSEWVN